MTFVAAVLRPGRAAHVADDDLPGAPSPATRSRTSPRRGGSRREAVLWWRSRWRRAPLRVRALVLRRRPPGRAEGRDRTRDIGGARLRFVDEGEGPPVVLIHGFASALETWRGVMPELAKKHRVLALDLKGFGWSSRPEGDYSPQAEAQLVLALLEQRGVHAAARRRALVGRLGRAGDGARGARSA